MKAWYLILSKPRKECVAKEQLELKGYEIYLPMICKPQNTGFSSKNSICPMFPRYFFINLCDETDDWESVSFTVGVANLVRFSQRPMRVPDDIIMSLKECEGGYSYNLPYTSKLQVGDKVKISTNVNYFGGLEAMVYTKSSDERVMLLLEIVQSNIKVKICESQLEKLV